MTYDTHLFIEIIESIEGIRFLRTDSNSGYQSRFYSGLRGNLVMIDCTDEYLEEEQGKGYLDDLGLAHLIPSLFPESVSEQSGS